MANGYLLAYLAGAIDSDGCIAVKRSTYSMRVRKDAGSPVFSERIMLKQVTPQVPNLLRATFGGSLHLEKASAKRGRAIYSWQTTDKQAVVCLKAILPHLRIKREQALNCLALRKLKEQSKRQRVARGRGHVGAAQRSSDLTEKMEALFRRAKELNTVGTKT